MSFFGFVFLGLVFLHTVQGQDWICNYRTSQIRGLWKRPNGLNGLVGIRKLWNAAEDLDKAKGCGDTWKPTDVCSDVNGWKGGHASCSLDPTKLNALACCKPHPQCTVDRLTDPDATKRVVAQPYDGNITVMMQMPWLSPTANLTDGSLRGFIASHYDEETILSMIDTDYTHVGMYASPEGRISIIFGTTAGPGGVCGARRLDDTVEDTVDAPTRNLAMGAAPSCATKDRSPLLVRLYELLEQAAESFERPNFIASKDLSQAAYYRLKNSQSKECTYPRAATPSEALCSDHPKSLSSDPTCRLARVPGTLTTPTACCYPEEDCPKRVVKEWIPSFEGEVHAWGKYLSRVWTAPGEMDEVMTDPGYTAYGVSERASGFLVAKPTTELTGYCFSVPEYPGTPTANSTALINQINAFRGTGKALSVDAELNRIAYYIAVNRATVQRSHYHNAVKCGSDGPGGVFKEGHESCEMDGKYLGQCTPFAVRNVLSYRASSGRLTSRYRRAAMSVTYTYHSDFDANNATHRADLVKFGQAYAKFAVSTEGPAFGFGAAHIRGPYVTYIFGTSLGDAGQCTGRPGRRLSELRKLWLDNSKPCGPGVGHPLEALAMEEINKAQKAILSAAPDVVWSVQLHRALGSHMDAYFSPQCSAPRFHEYPATTCQRHEESWAPEQVPLSVPIERRNIGCCGQDVENCLQKSVFKTFYPTADETKLNFTVVVTDGSYDPEGQYHVMTSHPIKRQKLLMEGSTKIGAHVHEKTTTRGLAKFNVILLSLPKTTPSPPTTTGGSNTNPSSGAGTRGTGPGKGPGTKAANSKTTTGAAGTLKPATLVVALCAVANLFNFI